MFIKDLICSLYLLNFLTAFGIFWKVLFFCFDHTYKLKLTASLIILLYGYKKMPYTFENAEAHALFRILII